MQSIVILHFHGFILDFDGLTDLNPQEAVGSWLENGPTFRGMHVLGEEVGGQNPDEIAGGAWVRAAAGFAAQLVERALFCPVTTSEYFLH